MDGEQVDTDQHSAKSSSHAQPAEVLPRQHSSDTKAPAGTLASQSSCTGSCIADNLLKWHLPLLLVILVLFGALVPGPGQLLGETPLTTICVIGIFLVSGLQLRTDEVMDALKAWPSALWGVIFIVGLSPLLGFALAAIPLEERAFSNGLALFACMPTTISSCAVLTGQAKGNVALALLFSVVTNIAATVTAPFWLGAVLVDAAADDEGPESGGEGASIDAVGLLLRLLWTILLPVVVGKGLQWIPGLPELVKAWKLYIKIASSVLLVLIPWVKVSEATDDFSSVSGTDLVYVALLGISLHLVMLFLNWLAVLVLPAKASEKKAVVLCASQKTLGTAVAVIEALGETSAGAPGLLVIPCILSHFVQIIIDALLAVRMASWKEWPGLLDESVDPSVDRESSEHGGGSIELATSGSSGSPPAAGTIGSPNDTAGEGLPDPDSALGTKSLSQQHLAPADMQAQPCMHAIVDSDQV